MVNILLTCLSDNKIDSELKEYFVRYEDGDRETMPEEQIQQVRQLYPCNYCGHMLSGRCM